MGQFFLSNFLSKFDYAKSILLYITLNLCILKYKYKNPPTKQKETTDATNEHAAKNKTPTTRQRQSTDGVTLDYLRSGIFRLDYFLIGDTQTKQ